MEQPLRIIVVGGGFAGIRAGLDLARARLPNTKITLISDKPHFEYHAALYRVVAGHSPLEICIPLREIFGTDDKDILVEEDTIVAVDFVAKTISGKSGTQYAYDYLVLALGSETAYFNIPGLRELSYGFKSIDDALRLKNHLHEVFSECEKLTPSARVCAAHIVVVGAGPTGVEVSAELSEYTKKLAQKHGLDQSLVKIDLIEAGPRILPQLPEAFVRPITRRLERLGVNILPNRPLAKEEVETIYLPDMQMKTKTVIWTSGVMPNSFYASLALLPKDKKGRVVVSEHLEVATMPGVYVLGDGASTQFSGMAQTALIDGSYAAHAICANIRGEKMNGYKSRRPINGIAVGEGWAGILIGTHAFYGRLGWWLRQLADLRFFMSILSIGKALSVFRSGKSITEACPICSKDI